jgi:hypothetical protein
MFGFLFERGRAMGVNLGDEISFFLVLITVLIFATIECLFSLKPPSYGFFYK